MKSEKPCIACHSVKPLDQFYRHPGMKDGHLNKCNPCIQDSVRKNRMAKLAYYREYDRMRASAPQRTIARSAYAETERGKAAMARAKLAWSERNADKRKAQLMLAKAVRAGRVQKHTCWVCDSPNTHGHHYDYSLPLDVTWLCPRHHADLHKMAREAMRKASEMEPA